LYYFSCYCLRCCLLSLNFAFLLGTPFYPGELEYATREPERWSTSSPPPVVVEGLGKR
jgi:hypothetical protein